MTFLKWNYVGKIIQAEVFEKARNPAYILHVDFGEEIGIKNPVRRLPNSISLKT
jgi:tRNA-binding protein